jgi:hypothetical protein
MAFARGFDGLVADDVIGRRFGVAHTGDLSPIAQTQTSSRLSKDAGQAASASG